MSRNIAITACAAFFSFAFLSAQQAPVLDAAQREAAAAIEAPRLPPALPPGITLPALGSTAPAGGIAPPLPGQLQAPAVPKVPESSRIPDLPKQPQAVPSTPLKKNPIVTSTSTSGQFIVHGNDLSLRSAFSSRCEEISGELGRLLKDRQPWALPIVVLLNSGEAAKKDGKAVIMSVSSLTHGGFHLQVTVNLRPDLRPSELRAEIVRALLAERILRNQKEVTVQRPLLLPDWVYTGVLEALDYRKQDRPSTLFAAIFKSGKIFGIEEIIEASPVEMDALSKTIYQISCCALVLALLEQPEGGERLTRFLGTLASDPKPERELLTLAFPSFALSPASLNKWWALQLASLSRPGVSEPLTAADTLKALDEALTIRYQAKASEIPKPKPVIAIVPTPTAPPPAPAAEPTTASPAPQSRPTIKPKTTADKPATVAVESPEADTPEAEEPAKRSFFSRLNPFSRPTQSDEEIINQAIEEAAREEAASTEAMADADVDAKAEKPATTEPPEAPELKPESAPVTVKGPKPDTRQPLFKKWFGDEKTAPEEKPADEAKPVTPEKPAEPAEAKMTETAPATPTPPQKSKPEKEKAEKDKPETPAATEEPKSTEDKKPSKLNPLNWFKDSKPKPQDGPIPQAVPVDEPATSEKTKSKEAPKSASLESWTDPRATFEALISQEVAVPETAEAETKEEKKEAEEKPKKKFLGLFGGKKPAEEAAKIEAPAPVEPAPAMPEVKETAPEKPKKEGFRLGSFFGGSKKEAPTEVPEEAPGTATMPEKPAMTEGEKNSKPAENVPPAVTPAAAAKTKISAKTETKPAAKDEPQVAAAIQIDNYAAILKRPDRKAILQRNLVALNALQHRCAVLFRPIVADYTALVMELMDGKAKNVDERLKRLRERSQKALDQSRAVRDQLDLHEANSSAAMSGVFEDYLRLPETIRRELPPRQDPISKYLDSLDKEFSR